MTEKSDARLTKLEQEILIMCQEVSEDEDAMCGEHLLADDIIDLITKYVG